MARGWDWAVRLLFVAALLGGCTDKTETSKVSGTIRVRLPVVDSRGNESFEERTLNGIDDLSVMKTRYAQFWYAPKVAPGGLEGPSVHTHFTKTADGLYVPLDSTTQQVATIAGQMEDLYRLDQEAGSVDLLSWPVKIGFAVRLVEGSSKVENNSFYDPGSDAILFVPYGDSSHLPLSLNRGVIAHEHFHSLFDRLVMRPLIDAGAANPDLRNTGSQAVVNRTVFLKAINEGLADVWGWIHTDDLVFVGRSLWSQMKTRELKVNDDPFLQNNLRMISRGEFNQTLDLIRDRVTNPASDFNGYAYGPGTQLSRVLLSILHGDDDSSPASDRTALAHRIIKALPALTEKMKSSDEQMEMPQVVKIIEDAEPLPERQLKREKNWVAP